MFAATGSGQLLPLFVVYRAECMWQSWVEGGPPGTQYARTKSGWFDAATFEEWFLKVILPWARKTPGKKCIIGDNLSSHINYKVIEFCEREEISFVLLPPNTTHLLQPLDVSFFHPLKQAWRRILTSHKMKHPSSKSLEKSRFPHLLKLLIAALPDKENIICAGFKKCGIIPVDRNIVLSRLPGTTVNTEDSALHKRVSDTLLNYLQECRRPEPQLFIRRKKMNVPPGKAVSLDDLTERVPEIPVPQPDEHQQQTENVDDPAPGPSTPFVNVTEHEEDEEEPTEEMELHLNDFVLVKIPGKKSIKYFVAKVIKFCIDGDVELSYLRTKNKGKTFYFPTLPDEASILASDIIFKFEKPVERRSKIFFKEEEVISKYF